jgi:hypothetical protein
MRLVTSSRGALRRRLPDLAAHLLSRRGVDLAALAAELLEELTGGPQDAAQVQARGCQVAERQVALAVVAGVVRQQLLRDVLEPRQRVALAAGPVKLAAPQQACRPACMPAAAGPLQHAGRVLGHPAVGDARAVSWGLGRRGAAAWRARPGAPEEPRGPLALGPEHPRHRRRAQLQAAPRLLHAPLAVDPAETHLAGRARERAHRCPQLQHARRNYKSHAPLCVAAVAPPIPTTARAAPGAPQSRRLPSKAAPSRPGRRREHLYQTTGRRYDYSAARSGRRRHCDVRCLHACALRRPHAPRPRRCTGLA